MKWIILLVIILLATTHAQYITDIGCEQDSDCNKGECIKVNDENFCQCDILYYAKEINGENIPCIEPLGEAAKGAFITAAVIYVTSMAIILVVHISIIIALSASDKIISKSVKSWQFDPRITISALAFNCIISFVFLGLLARYCFGQLEKPVFNIVADFAKVFYFEAVTAVVFYWYLALQSTPARAQEIARYPVLAVTLVIYFLWWAISSFVDSDSITYFHLGAALLFMAILVACLFYFGRKIISMLAPQNRTSASMARKVGLFLFAAAFVIIGLFVLLVASLVVNEMRSVAGYIAGSIYGIMIVEWMVHIGFLIIFSGGSIKRLGQGVVWAWKGRSRTGSSPMDVDIMKGSDTTNPGSTRNSTKRTESAVTLKASNQSTHSDLSDSVGVV